MGLTFEQKLDEILTGVRSLLAGGSIPFITLPTTPAPGLMDGGSTVPMPLDPPKPVYKAYVLPDSDFRLNGQLINHAVWLATDDQAEKLQMEIYMDTQEWLPVVSGVHPGSKSSVGPSGLKLLLIGYPVGNQPPTQKVGELLYEKNKDGVGRPGKWKIVDGGPPQHIKRAEWIELTQPFHNALVKLLNKGGDPAER